MHKFLIQSIGCRAAQSDAAALATMLARRGMEATRQVRSADLLILNTCTVTARADEDVRRALRRMHRENPAAKILVTGCYAQRAPQELAALPGVAWVVGNSHQSRIPAIVSAEEAAAGARIHVREISGERQLLLGPVEDAVGDRTRPNLKIQDGCNHRCSFCIIPSVRGPSRSAPASEVIRQVRKLSERYREVVLSGVNLGRWGREPGIRMRLADLLRRLLAETQVERLRLSSVEPMDLSDDLLELMAASPRIAKHVHAPLQTGSDSVLRRMRRPYRARHYAERIRKVRHLMPEAAIGADVMVGFPGETDQEFAENRRFIDSLPLTYLHVFTFSARPGTPAAEYPDQVPAEVRKERNRMLRELAAAKNLAFRRSFVGRALSAVTLSGGRRALTSNFIPVELAAEREPNRLIDVAIGGLTAKGVSECAPPSRAG